MLSRRIALYRTLLRRTRLAALIWRKRLALVGGAVLIGLAALAIARLSDEAQALFQRAIGPFPWLPLVLTPAVFVLIAWSTRRFAPTAAGSGIPQVIAATRMDADAVGPLVSMRTALFKLASMLLALLAGASVGREGPTVQISASVMASLHRLLQVPLRASVMIAGGAAGVAAAFNTPLAGVSFAIEELASAYEQRVTLLVMTAILISGMTSLGFAGDYIYFGTVDGTLSLGQTLLAAPVAGVLGGLLGGLFARLMLDLSIRRATVFPAAARHPLVWALACGILVAVIGVASGLTWGTGYIPARAIIEGAEAPWWFGPAKLVTTLATSLAGLPGGIFSPSLSAGAGVGNILRLIFPHDPSGPIVLLGMTAYFTGVVRAPLTAVIIVAEVTGSRSLILPLFSAALIADGTSRLVCKERLYHGLSRAFAPAPPVS